MLLAMQDESLRDTLIGELFTEKTKQRILKNQLLAILQDGYAVSRGEVDEGVAAVAVPFIWDRRDMSSVYPGRKRALKQLVFPASGIHCLRPSGTWNKKDVC